MGIQTPGLGAGLDDAHQPPTLENGAGDNPAVTTRIYKGRTSKAEPPKIQDAYASPNTATVLTAPYNVLKTYMKAKGGESYQTVKPYRAKMFKAEAVEFTRLEQIEEELRLGDGTRVLIRGGAAEDTDTSHTRRNGKAFPKVDRAWVMLDTETTLRPEHIGRTDVQALADHFIKENLSEEWQGVNYVAELSNSHGLKIKDKPGNEDLIRLHLFFLLDRPVSHPELKEWLKDSPVDRTLFQCVQMHFIGRPNIRGGDPIAERIYRKEDGAAKVTVPEITVSRKTLTEGTPLEGPPVALSTLLDALGHVPPEYHDDYDEWIGISKAIRFGQVRVKEFMAMDWDEREEHMISILDDWCSGTLWENKHGEPPVLSTYKGLDHILSELGDSAREDGDLISAGTIFSRARENGWTPPDLLSGTFTDEEMRVILGEYDQSFADSLELLLEQGNSDDSISEVLSLKDFQENEYPAPDHVFGPLMVKGAVNGYYGPGGAGKSTSVMQIGTAVASGREMWGLEVKHQMPVFVLLAEDDAGAVQERILLTIKMLGIEDAEDVPIGIWPKPATDLKLIHIDDDGSNRRAGAFYRPFIQALEKFIITHGSNPLIILDPAIDIAGVNQNATPPVHAFLKVFCGALCKVYGATMLIPNHPSKTAMKDGSGFAGVVQWETSVRQLILIGAPVGQDLRRTHSRIIATKKSNYGSWEDGLINVRFDGPILITSTEAEIKKEASKIRDHVAQITGRWIAEGLRVSKNTGGDRRARHLVRELAAQDIETSVREVKDLWDDLEALGVLDYQGSKGKRVMVGFTKGEKFDEFMRESLHFDHGELPPETFCNTPPIELDELNLDGPIELDEITGVE